MAILACHAKSQINRHCYYFKKDRKISVFIAWVVWRIKEGTILYVISHFTWHFSSMFNRLINVPLVSKFSHNNSRILKKKKKSFHGGSSPDIRVFNNYASNNSFFQNWYILIIEFIEVTFIGVIDLWKSLLNVL